ncbi:hypothetical protein LCGC14_2464150 [marine sediment metagenome]|uniref:Flagellar L-ring protein n=1 Tax=marine sediment metagenome TaxID=412755 RepID=A0A0F9BCC6_9ZZZZ
MKSSMQFLAMCLALATVAAPAWAGSIWSRARGRRTAIHVDDTARRTGDILTIVIDEESIIDNETNRNLDKQNSRTGSTTGTLDLANILFPVGKHIFDFPKLSLDSSAKTKFDGKATYDTTRSMEDQITVTVQDVLPNGNLVVLGMRQRSVAGDVQTMRVSGIVRPSDITFANTVQSDMVADFRISYSDGARENRFVKPGWLARLLNILNPF